LPLRSRSCTFTTGVFQVVARNLCAALRRSVASAAAPRTAGARLDSSRRVAADTIVTLITSRSFTPRPSGNADIPDRLRGDSPYLRRRRHHNGHNPAPPKPTYTDHRAARDTSASSGVSRAREMAACCLPICLPIYSPISLIDLPPTANMTRLRSNSLASSAPASPSPTPSCPAPLLPP